MSACVGCGLTVENGLLIAHLDPAGGITCGPNGLTAAAALAAADDGAMAAANNAQGTANTAITNAANAQSTANGANDSAAYRARLYGAHKTQAPVDQGPPAVNTPLLVQGGSHVATTNGSGDYILPFPNAFPTACLAVTANTGAAVFSRFIAVHDTGNGAAVSLRVFNGNTGAPEAGLTLRIVWIAIGY